MKLRLAIIALLAAITFVLLATGYSLRQTADKLETANKNHGGGGGSVVIHEMPPLPSGVRMADELRGQQLKPGDILKVGPDGKLRIIGGTSVSTPHDRNDSAKAGTAEVTRAPGGGGGRVYEMPSTYTVRAPDGRKIGVQITPDLPDNWTDCKRTSSTTMACY